MNYRHGFHAGNFADVHKHSALVCILQHLREKLAPFRVIDTHAGAGRYNLAGADAERTGEWRGGIGKLEAPISGPAAPLFAPYLESVVASRHDGLRAYPGSPLVIRHFLRADDRLIACEKEPVAARALVRELGRDARVKAIEIDGWTALNAYIPPRERRGLVLIDPPYERPDEFEHLATTAIAAWRKWPNGIFLLWYPLKERAAPNRLARELAEAIDVGILRAELLIMPPSAAGDRLFGSGLIVINPPWRLHDQLGVIGPALASLLGLENQGHSALEWIRAPR